MSQTWQVGQTIAMAMTMRRFSWLQVPGIPCEVEAISEVLPFQGNKLFNTGTDKMVCLLKDSGATLHSLDLNVTALMKNNNSHNHLSGWGFNGNFTLSSAFQSCQGCPETESNAQEEILMRL